MQSAHQGLSYTNAIILLDCISLPCHQEAMTLSRWQVDLQLFERRICEQHDLLCLFVAAVAFAQHSVWTVIV